MSDSQTSFGFSVLTNNALALDGSRFVLSHSARRSLQLLAEIRQKGPELSKTKSVYWLLYFRQQIREIEQRKCSRILSEVVEFSPDPGLRVIAIWLLGRCGGTVGTKRLVKFIDSKSFLIRKELARAFKRKHAWAEIRALLRTESNPRIIRLATSSVQREFQILLKRFVNSKDRRNLSPPTSKSYLATGVDLKTGTPAKSRTLIRIILERIHRLVSLRAGL